MQRRATPWLLALPLTVWTCHAALAQQDQNAPAVSAPVTAPAPGGSEEGASAAGKLVLLFGVGSTALGPENEAILDKASRLYREGNPIIMIVSGSSDTTGSPAQNLRLSQERANSVARGMAARGIPAERTQILAKGVTNLPIQTGPGVAEARPIHDVERHQPVEPPHRPEDLGRDRLRERHGRDGLEQVIPQPPPEERRPRRLLGLGDPPLHHRQPDLRLEVERDHPARRADGRDRRALGPNPVRHPTGRPGT